MKNAPRLILAVDQAAKSGWCIVRPLDTRHAVAEVMTPDHRDVLEHGIATTFAARRAVMVQFAQIMLQRGLRPTDVWLVLEDHSHVPVIKGHGTGSLVGMGKAFGRWEEQWLFHDFVRSHVECVAPKVWRGAVLDTNKGGDEGRSLAVDHLERVLGYRLDEDEAEACCIGLWASANLERVLRGEPAPKKPRAKRRKAVAA